MHLSKTIIYNWLTTNDKTELIELWSLADRVRREGVGDAIHLRGLLEISNYCCRKCRYCGINGVNKKIERYRLTEEEILSGAKQAFRLGYGTVVLQGGEDYGISALWLSEIIKKIKAATPLAVTLSLGERSNSDLAAWKKAGADRYLLRFETSDKKLYNYIHPPLKYGDRGRSRIAILNELKELNYEVGSGIMVGIPGQTHESLVEDLQIFIAMDFDMIGIGPYLPHPDTFLGKKYSLDSQDLLNNELNAYKMIALTRILCPDINMPSTTALATANTKNGYALGLQRGANVIMPNLTPINYRSKYLIYPAKSCINQDLTNQHQNVIKMITDLKRTVGKGQGPRKK